MVAFEYFLSVLGDLLSGIFRHEAISGTGITFIDIGIFFLILFIVVNALVVTVRGSDDLSDSALTERRLDKKYDEKRLRKVNGYRSSKSNNKFYSDSIKTLSSKAPKFRG